MRLQHRARLLVSLLVSGSVFLLVMLVIVTLAAAQSGQSAAPPRNTSRHTQPLDNNYEDLADPADITYNINSPPANVSENETNYEVDEVFMYNKNGINPVDS